MANIRSVNEIISSFLDLLRLAQPDLDTKPGTVARDLFIDGPANQLALLYDELANISDLQSLRLVTGSDLDKLAKNFGVTRQQANQSSGIALLTFQSIDAPIPILSGDTVTASNGFVFQIVTSTTVTPESSNFYKSVATKNRTHLDFVGITDEYAIEVTVRASTAGSSGNIGKYSLSSTTISGVSNVTNTQAFSGGSNLEGDATFRDRVFSIFNGSSIGTAIGYKNTALSISGVIDAIVIEPGDPLMTRDGTVVTTDNDGNKTIVSEGTGGKVDIIILGNSLQENTDSFIYKDKSNNNDPTSDKNDFVLGQISGDESKTVTKKRIDNIKNGILPTQPINELLEVSGSLSGTNFKPKTTDQYGRVSGNFEIVKDTGAYAGSPWGFDKFKWVSNKISLFEEDRVKGQSNGQDNLVFTDVLEIPKITQNIQIINENSTVSSSDRSIIQLLHYPCTNVTRVVNVNTGERYIVSNQNPDGSGSINSTGRIKITGNTLPMTSDVLQVDYNWVVTYDQYLDYDGRKYTDNTRSVVDSVDWGYSNLIRTEKISFIQDTSNSFYVGKALHPVSSVIYANKVEEIDAQVYKMTSGIYINRLAVDLTILSSETKNISNIKLKNSNVELYNTSSSDGTFYNTADLVNLSIKYTTTIILPTDTAAEENDYVTCFINYANVFVNSSNTSSGSINGFDISIPSDNISTTATSINLFVSYIANITELFSVGTTSLPLSRSGNSYLLNASYGFTAANQNFVIRKENLSVQKNLSNQYYIELSISSTDYLLDAYSVLSIIKLETGVEFWNEQNIGTVTTNITTGNYQLILSGVNSPAIDDKIIVFYNPKELRKFQPFTYSFEPIKTKLNQLQFDLSQNKYYINFGNFAAETNLTFSIVDTNTDISTVSDVDGYITLGPTNDIVYFSSTSNNFSSIYDILNKKILISGSSTKENNNIFDILSYNESTNILTIGNNLTNLTSKQISITRVLDGKELWSSDGYIDNSNKRIYLPSGVNVNGTSDYVYTIIYNSRNLRQSPTKVLSSTSDQVVNPGSITYYGNTLTKGTDIVFTATSTGLQQNMSEAIRKLLGLNSSDQISSSIKLANLVKLEKVTTISPNSNEVLSVLATYDVKNTKIKTNYLFENTLIEDQSLLSTEFVLPSTSNNTINIGDTKNLPKVGDRLRATFYILTSNDSETLSYTRNGILYTNKIFTSIDKVSISSGFRSSQSTRLSTASFNKPITGSRYRAYYDYIAPKINERIVIRYNYNDLINTTTFAIEDNRPINADVLVKQAKQIVVDVTMNIVVTSDYSTSSSIVIQNVKDTIINSISINQLGAVLDASDLINAAYTVDGVDRARITYFNKDGNEGQVLSIQAQKDEYFVAGTVDVSLESR